MKDYIAEFRKELSNREIRNLRSLALLCETL